MPRKGENIYKRKDNRWEGRYKVGFNESGKSRYRSVYGKSYQEVKIKLIALKAAPKEAVSSGSLTVKELFEEWLSAVKLRVKESTFANYRMKADKHLLPEFGSAVRSQLHRKEAEKRSVGKICKRYSYRFQVHDKVYQPYSRFQKSADRRYSSEN